jgi:hypothetical protein
MTPETKPPKARRKDAYISRLIISIPLNPMTPESFADAVKAIEGLSAALPEAAIITVNGASIGKV